MLNVELKKVGKCPSGLLDREGGHIVLPLEARSHLNEARANECNDVDIQGITTTTSTAAVKFYSHFSLSSRNEGYFLEYKVCY